MTRTLMIVAGVVSLAVVKAGGQTTTRPAAAESPPLEPRAAIRQGNELYEQGQYAEALDRYDRPAAPPPEVAAELLNNQAAARYKLGDYAGARDLWRQAASLRDAAFEAAARYNIGNADYAEALEQMQAPESGDGGGGGAIELLENARANYADAVRLDPTREDARANLELASRLIEQLRQQQQQQQQDQQGDQQQDDQESQEGEQQEGDQQQEPREGEQRQDEPSGQQEQQEGGSQDQNADDQPQQPEAGQGEQQPGEPQEQPPGEDEQQQQPEPGEEQPEDVEPQEGPEVDMTPGEAERLLQKIRDAEQQRREALRARAARGQQPVEKDW